MNEVATRGPVCLSYSLFRAQWLTEARMRTPDSRLFPDVPLSGFVSPWLTVPFLPGGKNNQSPGNAKLRMMALEFTPFYRDAPKKTKPGIANALVARIHDLSPRGR